jgi:hypothetical protein
MSEEEKINGEFAGKLTEFVESVANSVVSENSTQVNKMSEEEIRSMKRELDEAKPKAIRDAFQAFDSSDYWLKCGSLHSSSGTNPIGYFGVNEEGPLEIAGNLQRTSCRDLHEIRLEVGGTINLRAQTRSDAIALRFSEEPWFRRAQQVTGRST